MIARKVLTATGFLMPAGSNFEVFELKEGALDALINRGGDYGSQALEEYWRDNRISHSPTANELYRDYTQKPSFDHFVAMVDYVGDVLGQTSMQEFMEWQAYNRHLSSTSLMLCRDLILTQLAGNTRYESVPPRSRFVMQQTITKQEGAERLRYILDGASPTQSWVGALAPLMQEHASFAMLFRYFFVSKL